MSDVAKKGYLPGSPYPGIDPFSFAYRDLFFARETEARSLIRLTVMYRGVLLYSDSGMGKTSLVNAGLIRQAIDEGYQPERIRVQSKTEQEIVVERLSQEVEGEPPFLPSIFASYDQRESVVLSVAQFMEKVRHGAESGHPLLIFDQFEEWVTLFGEGSGGQSAQEVRASQEKILDAIVSLINDSLLPVKVLIALREDYLPRLTPFFERCPDLPDHYLWLTPLKGDQVYRAIRGPFKKYPETYQPEISPSLARKIVKQFEGRSGGEAIHLTEVQIVCQDLFGSEKEGPELEQYFADQGEVQGILEGYLDLVLESLGSDQQDPALALLTRMVTPAGTRNVISRDDLLTRVAYEDDIRRDLLEVTLDRLDEKTKLVRSEPRREVRYYELASEFLVERIRREAKRRQEQAEQRKLADAQQRAVQEARTAKRFRRWAVGLAVALLAIAIIGLVAIYNYRLAEKEAWNAKYYLARALTASAQAVAGRKPQLSLLLVLVARDQLEELPEKPQNIRRLHEQIADTETMLHQVLAQLGGVPLEEDDQDSVVAMGVPDKLQLVTLDSDGTVYRWDLHDLTSSSPITYELGSKYEAMALSQDGLKSAGRSADGRLHVRDVDNPESDPNVSSEQEGLTVVAFSPDGRWLVSGDRFGSVGLWKLDRPEDGPNTSPKHAGVVQAIAFDPDPERNVFATGGSDGNVLVWDIVDSMDLSEEIDPMDLSEEEEYEPVHYRHGPSGVEAVALSRGGRWLVAGGSDGTAKIWDLTGQEEPQHEAETQSPDFTELPGHEKGITSAAFSSDGLWLAIGCGDGTVHMWDLGAGGEPISSIEKRGSIVLRGHEKAISAVRFSPDRDWLASADDDGNVRLWLDVTNRTTGWSADPIVLHHNKGAMAVRFTPDMEQLVTVDLAGTEQRWSVTDPSISRVDLPEAQKSRSLPGWVDPDKVVLSSDGDQLTAVGTDGVVRLWNLATEVDAGKEAEPDGASLGEAIYESIVFSPDGNSLVTCDTDGLVQSLDTTHQDPKPQRFNLKDQLEDSTISTCVTNGKQLAIGTSDGEVLLTEIIDGEPPVWRQLTVLPPGVGVRWMALDIGGNLLAVGDEDRRTWLITLANGSTEPEELLDTSDENEQCVTGGATSFAYSLSGRFLAVGGEDGCVRLWDLKGAREAVRLPGHTGRIESLAFSPDGRWLASGSQDKRVQLWRVQWEDLRDAACTFVGRIMTEEEIKEYGLDFGREYVPICTD
jgi:WD40 repeat protein